ncbi:hypothetical protein JCM15457_914 [Liquorilactobacillus sucicola DSM 21376 = JCM 15457]|uniref:Uncharacterized protein n=1 Tax=Liquorilactobacillus sucicola DSM 21376 = JCM 15457 TaxID=1423806 RepID=A0A023CVS7_9LACO|nr:hypothetical protein [Liquorilactobacillus sucicola]KRN06081.1 hypothetical protein FD15_GL001270 [Liquorilactobacillus sucicola DSM 21376 = JCM 15457]GAJ26008.1 hypothetical protein JCM15457_914 [Liquorilactobacillus sucicola DSM 21376 = JCM 15457]
MTKNNSKSDWIPFYITTAITIIALGVTIYFNHKSLSCTNKQLKITQSEFKSKQNASLSAQATDVSSWINQHKKTPNGNMNFLVQAINSSSQPIYNVYLIVVKRNFNGNKKVSQKYNNSKIQEIKKYGDSYKWFLDIVPPEKEIYNFYPNNLQYSSSLNGVNYGVIMLFKDSRGNFWMRTDDGTLINEKNYFKSYQQLLNKLGFTKNVSEKLKGV